MYVRGWQLYRAGACVVGKNEDTSIDDWRGSIDTKTAKPKFPMSLVTFSSKNPVLFTVIEVSCNMTEEAFARHTQGMHEP